MKILNLYAGLGGNRKLWENVQVTAVELDPRIAAIYQRFHPQDRVVVGDAHQYLLDHYSEYDGVWSSPPRPPCPIGPGGRHSDILARASGLSVLGLEFHGRRQLASSDRETAPDP